MSLGEVFSIPGNGGYKMASETSAQRVQTGQQQRLLARREVIVRELGRINQEITDAEQQLARTNSLHAASPQIPKRVAA